MFKIRLYTLIYIICAFLLMGISAYGASEPDDYGDYYIENKGTDGDVTKFEVTIERLTLKNSLTGAEVTLMDTAVTKDITQASSGQVAAYFKQNIVIDAGQYNQVGVQFNASSTIRGAVQIPIGESNAGKFYATNQGATLYDTLIAALSASGDLVDPDAHPGDLEYVPESPTGTITIEDGKSYTLKVLWSVCGLETDEVSNDAGVGIVWDTSASEMIVGMMQEQYIMVDQDGNEQYFTGD